MRISDWNSDVCSSDFRRAAHIRGEIDDAAYDRYLKVETKAAVRWRAEIGLDVLVHGEFERNDMVQYFGEQLAGFAFIRSGWVQSYGSRCVRTPILSDDVSRPVPMTVVRSEEHSTEQQTLMSNSY